MSVPIYLKTARKERGLTLRQAASLLGINHSTLYRYEEGFIQNIPYDKLKKVLALYQVDFDELNLSEHLFNQQLRLQIYEESRLEITAGFLYEHYVALDDRGKVTVLGVLMSEYEKCVRHRKPQRP